MAHRGLHVKLPVVLTNSPHNFVSLPKALANSTRATLPAKSHGVVAFRLGWLSPPSEESGGVARPSQAFVGWTEAISEGHYLAVPLALAETLGLKEAVECANALAPDSPLLVSVSAIPYAPIATRVDVDPVTPDDWECLQLHANLVEEELLSQICVLGQGQQFPMWVHGHTRINMQVSNIGLQEKGSAFCVRLARNTEVVVAPKLRSKADQYKTQSLRQNEMVENKAVLSANLRVQDWKSMHPSGATRLQEEGWNCTAAVHTSTLEKFSAGAKWPKMQVLRDGTVVYTSDPATPVFIKISNSKRNKLLAKANGAELSNANAVLVSSLNQSFAKLVAFDQVAPNHVVLPLTLQASCKVHPLEEVSLTLARFQPIACPEAFPALRVRLAPIQSGAELAHVAYSTDRLDNRQVAESSSAAQKWQQRLQQSATMSHGLPLWNGAIISLQLDPKPDSKPATGKQEQEKEHNQEPKQGKAGRVAYFGVYIDDAGEKKVNGKEPSAGTLEPVHWHLLGSSKVEWSIDRAVVEATSPWRPSKAASVSGGDAHVPSSSTIGAESDGTDTEPLSESATPPPVTQSNPSNKKQLPKVDLGQYNNDFYGSFALNELGGVEKYVPLLMHKLAPMLNRASASKRVQLGAPHPGGLYICGGRGCGKTTLVKAVARELRVSPESLTHTVWLGCASLRGGKRSEVEATFTKVFKEALKRAPSLIVLDDLDLLLPAPVGGAGAAAEDAQLIWLAEWLEDLFRDYQQKLERFEHYDQEVLGGKDRSTRATQRALSWIATGREKDSLRGSLLRTGLFDKTIEIEPLTAHHRTTVMESLLARHNQNATKLDLDEIAGQAEGYAPADLDVLVQRAMHASVLRLIDAHSESTLEDNDAAEGIETVQLVQEDFEHALDGFTPAALQGVALAKSDVKWSDVGGLLTVRRVLKETLELPIQFAPLYDRSPQRLASGILLYGPPGCGKTLLAGAVAKECGLNFISVKGPEVLNKYIGASEQAIRDLFARGAAAAPCVLFFDEFDAVAPRRGNDSSGVTDRVVNQLLTFLDGVEARSGVYVMAASSRPDLVDPALLRPGRLDKQLLCNFPTAEERTDILRTIGSKMSLSQAASDMLEEIATSKEAELYTGADLQAILYSAQLAVIHQAIPPNLDTEESKGTEAKAAEEDIQASVPGPSSNPEEASGMIEPKHLKAALLDARPSVSKEERERYNAIYSAFSGDRGADFNAVSGYPDGKQRTALK